MPLPGIAQLSYNGVPLEVLTFNEPLGPQLVNTADETTRLFKEWVVDVVCIFNPQATSFDATGSPAAGQQPVDSFTRIHEKLSQHQKRLILKINNVTVIDVPPDRHKTDARNGPKVERCQVLQMHGYRSFMFHFRVVCWINDCEPKTPILAHRWRVHADVDQDHFAVLVREGEVWFRTDYLTANNVEPDQFRTAFAAHAVPATMQRESIKVIVHEANNRVTYQVVDREKAFGFLPASQATRFEAYQTESFSKNSFWSMFAGQFNNAAPGMFSNMVSGSFGQAVSQMASAGWDAFKQAAPRFYSHVLVRAWGHRLSSKRILVEAALAIAVEKIAFHPNLEVVITQDLNGKFVEVQMTRTTGAETLNQGVTQLFLQPIINLFDQQAAAAGVVNNPLFNSQAGVNHLLTAFGNEDGQILSQAFPLPGPANANGTRGTWIGQLVAQALGAPCGNPPIVPKENNPTVEVSLSQG